MRTGKSKTSKDTKDLTIAFANLMYELEKHMTESMRRDYLLEVEPEIGLGTLERVTCNHNDWRVYVEYDTGLLTSYDINTVNKFRKIIVKLLIEKHNRGLSTNGYDRLCDAISDWQMKYMPEFAEEILAEKESLLSKPNPTSGPNYNDKSSNELRMIIKECITILIQRNDPM